MPHNGKKVGLGWEGCHMDTMSRGAAAAAGQAQQALNAMSAWMARPGRPCNPLFDAAHEGGVQAGHVHAHEGAALWGREGREGGGVLSRYVPSHGRHPDSAHGMPQHAQHAS